MRCVLSSLTEFSNLRVFVSRFLQWSFVYISERFERFELRFGPLKFVFITHYTDVFWKFCRCIGLILLICSNFRLIFDPPYKRYIYRFSIRGNRDLRLLSFSFSVYEVFYILVSILCLNYLLFEVCVSLFYLRLISFVLYNERSVIPKNTRLL